ncbi:MAG: hypothetical protein JSS87_07830 [Acidobacteria bacterium]|nr:hypothetical protein [Acidobacteriota bacterium]
MSRVLALAVVLAASAALAQNNSDAPSAPDNSLMPGVPEYKQNPPQLSPDGLPPMYAARMVRQRPDAETDTRTSTTSRETTTHNPDGSTVNHNNRTTTTHSTSGNTQHSSTPIAHTTTHTRTTSTHTHTNSATTVEKSDSPPAPDVR